jgi:hypothetical protein
VGAGLHKVPFIYYDLHMLTKPIFMYYDLHMSTKPIFMYYDLHMSTKLIFMYYDLHMLTKPFLHVMIWYVNKAPPMRSDLHMSMLMITFPYAFVMGKAHEWVTFSKCWANWSDQIGPNLLVLGSLFWGCLLPPWRLCTTL